MVRREIKEGPIKIAYGGDDMIGYFLSVEDTRLSWKSEATKEVNDFVDKFGIGDGGGSYFNITTGFGIGEKVSQRVYLEFLERYGVPESHIAAVRAGSFNFP